MTIIDKRLTVKIKGALDTVHALSLPTRQKIIAALDNHGPMGVNDIAKAISLSQPKCSLHLAILRKAKLVTYTVSPDDARSVIYTADMEKVEATIEYAKQIYK